MKPSDEERDALTDAYRKASARDAGGPGAATRNAILAEAAAAARRRAPAANDSRYLWRGVAGVAVLGFSVLLWQQVDHRLPGEEPAAAAASSVHETIMEKAPPPMTAPAGRPQAKMSAEQDAETDADKLLRLHFPQQYQSSTPHRLWLVQDATGALLRSGELAEGQDFAGLRPEIERQLGGRLLRPWRIRSLRNGQGQLIELGIAQTP